MKPPAFQFYPDDFIGGTCDLSAQDVGAYIRLLCYQWSRGSIPIDDLTKLARIAGAKVTQDVLRKFPLGVNARLETERVKQDEYRAKQSAKGHASALARFNRGSTVVQPSGKPQGQPEVNSPSPSPSSVSKKEEKKPKAPKLSDDEWMASLKTNPDHEGKSIESEFRRASEWVSKNPDRKMSRRFFENWLDRCEKPLTIKPKPKPPESCLGHTGPWPKGHSFL
jgi:uncharacterized protein YdaU (DUF1376 family)